MGHLVFIEQNPLPFATLLGVRSAPSPRPSALLEGELRELNDELIAAHIEHGPKVPSVQSTMHIYPINGACHRVAPDATAFGHLDASFATVIAGIWENPKDNEENIAWVWDYHAATAPHSKEGGYINFMAGDDQERVAYNYSASYERLIDIKKKYGAGNLFRMNQNIRVP